MRPMVRELRHEVLPAAAAAVVLAAVVLAPFVVLGGRVVELLLELIWEQCVRHILQVLVLEFVHGQRVALAGYAL